MRNQLIQNGSLFSKDLVARLFAARPGTFAQKTEPLIRAELFGVERLEQHAESLAAAQRVTEDSRSGRRLNRRLKDNGRALLGAYRGVEKAVREERHITPADEWLLDNFFVAQEQIRQVRDDLPHDFYRGLPKIADGPLRGYPRVFGIAWAFVAHTDSRVDREMLIRFVNAYQRVQPLTIGELWAVAIALRIVLIENLRRAADEIVNARAARAEADALADELLGLGGREAISPKAALLRFDAVPLAAPFVVRLLERLRDQDPRVTPAVSWLEERLATKGTCCDDMVRAEHQRQVGTNVTVRNIITSMRVVSMLDWAKIFESTSLVDASLREHGGFAQMDFPTRDRYRHAIAEAAGGDTITFSNSTAGGATNFYDTMARAIPLTSGELTIGKDLIITGPGANVLTISGNQASRVFSINAGVAVTIQNVTIANGNDKASGNAGGGIYSNGTLTISNCTVTANSVTNNFLIMDGGGIYNNGALTMTNSTISRLPT